MQKTTVINWHEYFMGIALLSSFRSKDPNTKVGACIVNEYKRIVGIGYNGMPHGCSDDVFPWARDGEYIDQKYLYVVHAELNAILNATGSVRGCSIYVALFPCNECCKAIIQSGISKIYYISDKYADTDSVKAGKRMLDAAGVEYEQFTTNLKELSLNFQGE
ncbi:MAG: dCMP deaminase family protein [Clostridia bacterium]